METMTEAIDLTLPDGSVRTVPGGHHAARGRRLDRPAPGQGRRGRRARRPQDRPAPAAPPGGRVPHLHHQEPGGRRVHPPQRRARAGRRRQAALAGGGVSTPAARTTARSSSTTSASRAPSPPRTSRRSRTRCARSSPRRARFERIEVSPRGGRADLPRAGRDPEGRAPEGHPRGGDDHPLPRRPLHRPLPRAARAEPGADRRGQAARGLRRLLQGGREERAPAAHLRHRLRLRRRRWRSTWRRMERARARDHRRLGQELDLFSFNPLAPAMPFLHPKGAVDLQRARSTTCASSTPATATAR